MAKIESKIKIEKRVSLRNASWYQLYVSNGTILTTSDLDEAINFYQNDERIYALVVVEDYDKSGYMEKLITYRDVDFPVDIHHLFSMRLYTSVNFILNKYGGFGSEIIDFQEDSFAFTSYYKHFPKLLDENRKKILLSRNRILKLGMKEVESKISTICSETCSLIDRLIAPQLEKFESRQTIDLNDIQNRYDE